MQDISANRFVSPQPLKTAVLFLPFIRLDATKQVFEEIRKARPPRFYIASDGPRDSRPGEDEKVVAVRDYVMNHIDWELFWKMIACRILLFLGFARSCWSDTGRMSELGS